MNVKTFRMTKEIADAMNYVAKAEKIEKSQSLRKLASLGFEAYVAHLYKNGRVSLRESAQLLKKTMADTILLMMDHGVSGNITATEVFESLENLDSTPPL
jgi:hypothetical protein